MKSIGTTDVGIVKYSSEADSIYDFMYAFKFGNDCVVKKDSVKKWFYGDGAVTEKELIAKTDEIKNIIVND